MIPITTLNIDSWKPFINALACERKERHNKTIPPLHQTQLIEVHNGHEIPTTRP